MKYLRLAFSFLTIIPVKIDEEVDIGDLDKAAGWFPLVGLVIGGVVALVRWGAGILLPPLAAAVLSVGCWAWLTGGLHLDGFADCCDGMLASATPERRLAIMKDPRLGTFGGAGLALHLMLKVVLLAALSGVPVVLAVVLATTLGRWMVVLSSRQPRARSAGLGVSFASDLRWVTYIAASVLPFVIVTLAGLRGVIAAVIVHLAGLAVFGLSKRRLGGITGDVYGMLIEISEVVVLLVFTAQ